MKPDALSPPHTASVMLQGSNDSSTLEVPCGEEGVPGMQLLNEKVWLRNQ